VKFILTGIVLTVAIVGVSVAVDLQSRTTADRPPQNDGPRPIFASGRIEGVTPEVKLRPQIAGRIVGIPVKEAQCVRAGDVLLDLDSAELAQEVAIAEAEFHLAEAQLEKLMNGAHPKQRDEAAAIHRAKSAELQRAKLTWQRIEELLRKQSATAQEADDQRTLVAALTAETEAAYAHLQWLDSPARADEIKMETARVQQAKARWKLAEVQFDRTRLRAPFAGEILKINAEVGELAGPASPDPAVVMADTSRGYVRAFIEEMDARRVRVGMPARMTIAGSQEEQLQGRIVRLSPRMEDKSLWNDHPTERLDTKTREIWIELDEHLPVIGLRVDVVIDDNGRAACSPVSKRPPRTSEPSFGE
jgi:HlyD family secretion protein